MNHRKRLAALMMALLLGMTSAGCAAAEDDAPLTIIATIFPAYDLAREVAGETASIQMLLPPGGESHSYEPTPQEIIAIQNADLFIYNGGESEDWVERVLNSMGDDAPNTFRMMDHVSAVTEEIVEGMQHDHDHEEEEAELDEHVWTSPKNMVLIAEALASRLTVIDPSYDYIQKAQGYVAKLNELDAAITEIVSTAKRDLIVFGDRFPLRYFADAYGLCYMAAFPGCSEDSEPDVRTVMTLVDRVRTEQIPVVFYIEFSSRKTADIIAEETGATELLFHSCHAIGSDELAAGASYLSLMWQNAENLKEALN